MLVIKNFIKKINNKKILDNFELSAEHGTINILLGPSGVGKTTFLRALNNLETIDSGKINLDGKELSIEKINKKHLSGLVFQNFNLFDNLTVKENITFVLKKSKNINTKDASKTAEILLQKYDLLEHKNKYPCNLSGGQKQRLAIARALALEPKIICLDEPTSALDPKLTSLVAQTISELAKENYIVILTTHDTSLIKKLDAKINLMQRGKIIKSVNTKDFENDPKQYPEILEFIEGH